VQDIVYAVKGGAPCQVSVSAGRIADTGRDPVPLMADAVERLKEAPNARDHCANDILKRLSLVGKDMDDYSLET
jgi:transaldolase